MSCRVGGEGEDHARGRCYCREKPERLSQRAQACLKNILNASRPYEHPSVRGEKVSKSGGGSASVLLNVLNH